MKRILYSLAFVAAATLAACSTDDTAEREGTNESGRTLVFESVKPALDNDVRTAWDAAANTIKWSHGDKIRVAYTIGDIWQNAAGTATDSSSAKFYVSNQFSGDNAETAQFSVPTSFKDGKTAGNYCFYAVYPSTITGTSTDFSAAPIATVTIPEQQTPAAGSFDSEADFMIAKSVDTYTALPTEPISLSWKRMVAHGDFTLKNINITAGETVGSVKFTANEGAELTGTYLADISTREIASDTPSNALTVKCDNLTANGGNLEMWVCMLPCTITSLKVEIDTNKATYTREISGLSLTFKGNTRNILGIDMSTADRNEKPQSPQLIEDGDYYICASGKYMGLGDQTDDRLAALDAPDDSAIWDIAYMGSNKYTVKSASNGMYLKAGSSSDLSCNTSDVNQATQFTVTFDETAGTYKFTNAESNRWISYNSASGGMFRMYSSNYPSVTLEKVVTTPTFSLLKSAIEVSAAEGTHTENGVYKLSFASDSDVTVGCDGQVVTSASVAGGALTYTVTANDSETETRTGSVTLTFNGETFTVTITQGLKGAAVSVGEPWTHTFNSNNPKLGTTAQTFNGLSWKTDKDISNYETTGDNRGWQFGAAKGTINVISDSYAQYINYMELVVSTNGTGNTISVTVGGKSLGNTITLHSGDKNKTISFESTELLQGQIVITINDKAKSVYLKTISINK